MAKGPPTATFVYMIDRGVNAGSSKSDAFRDFQTEYGQWGLEQSHKSRPYREEEALVGSGAVVVAVGHRPDEVQGQAVEGDLDGGE